MWLPLLLALGFRSLIPVGYMPMIDAQGRVSMMLCPADSRPLIAAIGAAVAVEPQAQHHAHQHHEHHPGMVMPAMSDMEMARAPALADTTHSHAGRSDHAADNHSPCVFAASGLAGLLPSFDAHVAAAAPPSVALALFVSQIPSRVLPRSHAARGPPA